MGKSFVRGVLSYFVGSALSMVVIIVFLRIGWQDKEKVLILGYGALGSLCYFLYNVAKQIKNKDMEEINEKLKKKADISEIEIIKEKITSVHVQMEHNLCVQEEMHTTIDNIYKELLNRRNGNALIGGN